MACEEPCHVPQAAGSKKPSGKQLFGSTSGVSNMRQSISNWTHIHTIICTRIHTHTVYHSVNTIMGQSQMGDYQLVVILYNPQKTRISPLHSATKSRSFFWSPVHDEDLREVVTQPGVGVQLWHIFFLTTRRQSQISTQVNVIYLILCIYSCDMYLYQYRNIDWHCIKYCYYYWWYNF